MVKYIQTRTGSWGPWDTNIQTIPMVFGSSGILFGTRLIQKASDLARVNIFPEIPTPWGFPSPWTCPFKKSWEFMAIFSDFDVWEPIFLEMFIDDGILQFYSCSTLLRPSKCSTFKVGDQKTPTWWALTTEKCRDKVDTSSPHRCFRPYEYHWIPSFVPEFVGLMVIKDLAMEFHHWWFVSITKPPYFLDFPI